jgi:hypothetical protein
LAFFFCGFFVRFSARGVQKHHKYFSSLNQFFFFPLKLFIALFRQLSAWQEIPKDVVFLNKT